MSRSRLDLHFYLTLVRIDKQVENIPVLAGPGPEFPMRTDAQARSAMTRRASRGPAATPPKAPPDDTRRQILNAAAKLFRQNGYASTSLRDIAAATGM